MITFPTSIIPQYDYSMSVEFQNLVSGFETGKEQRRRIWRFPKRTIQLTFNAVQTSVSNALYDFFRARVGNFSPFWFIEPNAEPYNTTNNAHYDQFVGIGNSVNTAFDLPAYASTAWTIYRNGTALSSVTQYTISTGAGDAGSDQLRITTSAPAAGDIITADYQGRLMIPMRFAEGSLTRTQFEASLFSYGINLIEVKLSS